MTDSGRATDGSFTAYADIAPYRNITVYLFVGIELITVRLI